MKRSKPALLIGSIVFISLASFSLFSIFLLLRSEPQPVDHLIDYFNHRKTSTSSNSFEVKTFENQQEFNTYIKENKSNDYYYGRGNVLPPDISELFGKSGARSLTDGEESAQRYSTTNVRTEGIDEPDVIKTDGEHIYLSNEFYSYYGIPEIRVEGDIELDRFLPPYIRRSNVKVFNVLPVDDINQVSTIRENGELLLDGDNLVVVADDALVMYNVSNPEKPAQVWEYVFKDGYYAQQVRNIDGELIVMLHSYLGSTPVCPLNPLSDLKIACDDIYYSPELSADSASIMVKLNLASGNLVDSSAVLTTDYQTVLYVSNNYTYLISPINLDYTDIQLKFYEQIDGSILPGSVIREIDQVLALDLHDSSKYTEIQAIIEDYSKGLESNDLVKLSKQLSEGMKKFEQSQARELYRSGIVRIANDDFSKVVTVELPGYLLNEFAVDEHNSYLRVATTVSGNLGSESANDVYVFDNDLKQTGKIIDLGLDERIYSARFVGDTAYLVTFKQVDPFFVLDLSNPSAPMLRGELKIPGFSSYLHPFGDKVIGIGRDNGQIKVSLFDVSDKDNPIEIDNLKLDEYYTEVENNHHAFLLDASNSVFFLPTSGKAYFISVDNNQLAIVKKANIADAKRMIYVNNYYYVFSSDALRVFDADNGWRLVNEVAL